MALALSKVTLMIDYRELTFDASAIAGITLVRDHYLGLGIIAAVPGGHAIASLEPQSMFEVSFVGASEGSGPRFFIPNCDLRLDHNSVGDHRQDPPLGSLILSEGGISLMVKPPRSMPSPLRLIGKAIDQAHREMFVTRWRLQSSARFGDPEVLFGHGAPNMEGTTGQH